MNRFFATTDRVFLPANNHGLLAQGRFRRDNSFNVDVHAELFLKFRKAGALLPDERAEQRKRDGETLGRRDCWCLNR